jgi:hypothetical protein
MPDTGGQPIHAVGIAARGAGAGETRICLDSLGWDGTPDVLLGRPGGEGILWRRAWVDGVDQFEGRWREPYRIVQNEGRGLISQGTPEWRDYRASVPMTIHLAEAAGLAARVQGLRRYYALLLGRDGMARLVRAWDGCETLAEAPFPVEFERVYELELTVEGARIVASVDGRQVFAVEDPDPLPGGGVGLVVEEGSASAEAVRVRPGAG